MKSKDVYALIIERGDNYLDLIAEHTDSLRVAFKVLAMHAEEQAKLYPYVNVHARCVRYCRACDCSSVSEMIACYEEEASRVVNNPKNW